MTHDCKRNSTTTLFAAMSVLDGQIIAQCQPRHRHEEWLKFFRQIDKETPQGKTLHLICDNYATHKHPNVKKWLGKHPRVHMHFTPTSVSWMNMVERLWDGIAVYSRTENKVLLCSIASGFDSGSGRSSEWLTVALRTK